MNIPLSMTGQLLAGTEAEFVGPEIVSRITRFAPSVEVAPSGASLIVRVQSVAGPSPLAAQMIQATIPSGLKYATPVTGNVEIAANARFYVYVSSGPTGGNAASYLNGYCETTGGVTSFSFASVAAFKTAEGITVATYDADIAAIIQYVTSAMQQFMGRRIVITSSGSELHSARGLDRLITLKRFPIFVVSDVRIDGVSIPSTEWVILYESGQLYRASGWPAGSYHIAVDYTSGFLTTPPELVGACLNQSRYQWRLTKEGGNRLVVASQSEPTGGSRAHVVSDWAPGVEASMLPFRRVLV